MLLKFIGLVLTIWSLYLFLISFKKGFRVLCLEGYFLVCGIMMALGLWLLGIFNYLPK